MLSRSLLCKTCTVQQYSPKDIVSRDHYLIFMKDQGGLLYILEDVLKILKTFELVSKTGSQWQRFSGP